MQSKEPNSVQFHDDPKIQWEQPSAAPSSLGAFRVAFMTLYGVRGLEFGTYTSSAWSLVSVEALFTDDGYFNVTKALTTYTQIILLSLKKFKPVNVNHFIFLHSRTTRPIVVA